MKKIFFLMMIAIIISFFSMAQSSWEQITSPVSEKFISVCFTDAQHGWILSEDGTLLSTENGGSSWQTMDLGSDTYTCVHFTDQNHGCITGHGDSSVIMVTTNGGTDWTTVEHEKAYHLNHVYFHDGDIGWAVGVKDNMNYNLYTDNGGNTWTPQMDIFVMNAELYCIHFRDALTGNTCGAEGAFFTTNSGGISGWAMNISIPSLGVDLYSIYNWGMLNGSAVGSNGTALYTTDNWGSYIETTTNVTVNLYGVSGVPPTNKLWACGEGGTIIYTSNYIFGWIAQPTPVTKHLNDIQMIDENNGWAVGDNGTILKYGLLPGINELDISGLEVFPNPTRGIVDCRLSIVDLGFVELKLFDPQGREVAVIVDQVLTPGEHSFQFDTGQLTPGVYFLRQSAVGSWQFAVRKLVVLD